MDIAMLGTGDVGKRLGLLLSENHRVRYGTRSPKERQNDILHEAVVTSYAEAAQDAEVIIVATPWAGNVTLGILTTLEPKAQQVFIDCTNPLAHDYMSNLIGHTTSSGEQVAEAAKPAKTAKAFNTIFADVMAMGKQQFGGIKGTGFFCGDDDEAKRVAKRLLEDAGFDPVDAGEMKNARYLESMAQLNIQIAYGMNGGTDVAFNYMRRGAP